MEEEHSSSTQTPQKNIGMAVVAYFIFFIPLLTKAKDDPFVKYHVKQGLLLFITSVGLSFIGMMPVIMMFSWILSFAILALLVFGVLHALAGKQEPLPLIGHLADNFDF